MIFMPKHRISVIFGTRPEAMEAGTVKLVGTDYNRIVAETTRLLSDNDAYNAMSRNHNPYGDGQAAGRIVQG